MSQLKQIVRHDLSPGALNPKPSRSRKPSTRPELRSNLPKSLLLFLFDNNAPDQYSEDTLIVASAYGFRRNTSNAGYR